MLFKKEDEFEVVSSTITLYDTEFKDEDFIKLLNLINASTLYELYIDIYLTHIDEKYLKVLYNLLKNRSVVQDILITIKNDADDTVLTLLTLTNSYMENNIRFKIRKQEDIDNKDYFNFLKFNLYNFFGEMEINQLFEQDYYVNSYEASKRKIVNQVINIEQALQLINKYL